MFETFSPGYYEQYYGQFLSEAAHGIAYKLLMRTYGPVQQDGGRLVLGNHFDSGIATLIINGLTAVLSGYFNFVNEMLPRNLIAANLEVSSKFEGLKGWLNHAIEALMTPNTKLLTTVDTMSRS